MPDEILFLPKYLTLIDTNSVSNERSIFYAKGV